LVFSPKNQDNINFSIARYKAHQNSASNLLDLVRADYSRSRDCGRPKFGVTSY
jgi:hypothetical protein